MKHIKDFSLNEDIISKYPELDNIAKEVERITVREINKRVELVESTMPYKAQYVLEKLIEFLEKDV